MKKAYWTTLLIYGILRIFDNNTLNFKFKSPNIVLLICLLFLCQLDKYKKKYIPKLSLNVFCRYNAPRFFHNTM